MFLDLEKSPRSHTTLAMAVFLAGRTLNSISEEATQIIKEIFPPAGEPEEQSIAPVVRIGRAKKALALYQQAADLAKSRLDRAVTSRNLGIAAEKLATFTAFQDRESIELIVYYFTLAAQALLKALVSGCHAKGPEWQEGVRAKLSRLAEDYMRYLVGRTDDWKIRVSKLDQLAAQLPTETRECREQGAPVLATIKLYELSELVRVADAALDDGEENGWMRAGSALAAANGPRVEAEQALARAAALPRAVWASTAERRDELELGWALARRRAEVAQHLALAASERAAIFNDEAFDVDRCWRIVDLLGTAMRQEIDIQQLFEGIQKKQ